MKNKFKHISVMVNEAIDLLNVKSNGIYPHTKTFGARVYVDGTLGGGGHTAAMLRKLETLNSKFKTQIIGIDQDEEAIEAAKRKLKKYNDEVIFVHENFKNLDEILFRLKIDKVDGILIDLGVSSYQLDNPERGFSFKKDKDQVLDMRMNRNEKLTAFDVVNNYDEQKLRRIFFTYGEEPFSRQIARKVVIMRRQKPIKTVGNLLAIIKSATPPKYRFSRRKHFATKIFQALRIEVNQEIDALREVLPQAIERLKNGGRLVVISFHSLEDRAVKHFFKEMEQQEKAKILIKKPIIPTEIEISLNPRASSAKMRAIEKII